MGLIKRFLIPCICVGLILAAGPGATGPADAQTDNPPAGFTGIWTGTLRVTPCMATLRDRSRCGAVNNITFTIIQDDSQVSGHYTCAIGTAICRNGNDAKTGKITSGRVERQATSASRCWFRPTSPIATTPATAPKSGTMRGGYSCYQGGGLIEQGMFRSNARWAAEPAVLFTTAGRTSRILYADI